jgi:hypothetical protein
MEKLKSEDPETTQKYNPEDGPDLSYTQSTTSSSLSSSSVLSKSSKKKHKKPTYKDYYNRYREEHALIWQTYVEWKKVLPKEDMGSSRPLLQQELIYFEYTKRNYESLPVTRDKPHSFTQPPLSWKLRYASCPIPSNFTNVMDELIQFSKKYCATMERNNWEKVLKPLEISSLEHLLWAIAFLKSTNGVADTVSCGHSRKLIANCLEIKLEIYKFLLRIAAMI